MNFQNLEVKPLNVFSKEGCQVFPIIVPAEYGLKTINFFLVQTKKTLSLIDAGIDSQKCWDALLRTLQDNQLKLEDLTEIILTHHHYDHVGLVNKIVAQHPVPVYASPLSIPRLKRDSSYMEKRVKFYEELYQEMGCGELGDKQVSYLKKAVVKNIHQALQTDIIDIADSNLLHFRIIEIPGHAPDQIALWDEDRQWLFPGDLLLEHISSNAFVEPDDTGKRLYTLIQQRNSLETCYSLNPRIVFPGHGSIIEESSKLIEKRIERIETKADRFLQLIQNGISTAHHLAETFYKNTYYEQFPLVMSEIVSHLDYLESQGKITKNNNQGVWHYSVNKQEEAL